MPEIKLQYRHNHQCQPHYLNNADIERVALEVRRQLGVSERRALTIQDLAGIERLHVNGVEFDVWVDLDVIFRRRLHQLTGRNARCAVGS